MTAKKHIDKMSEILEPVHRAAVELAELDKQGKAHLIEYTEIDVIAAAVVFLHVMANRKAHSYMRKDDPVDLEKVEQDMEEYGERIHELVYEMANVKLSEKGNSDEQSKQ